MEVVGIFSWWIMNGQWSSFEDGKDIRDHVYSRILYNTVHDFQLNTSTST